MNRLERTVDARAFMAVLLLGFTTSVWSAELHVKLTEKSSPPEQLSDAIKSTLPASSYAVVDAEEKPLCQIWLSKNWTVSSSQSTAADILYSFVPGELLGAIQFPRRHADYREQRISKGVYTLRYALQPVDGNHVGTSPTRDFLLLVKASDDTSAVPFELEELMTASAAAARTSHPAMLSLRKPPENPAQPTVVHHEGDEVWVLTLVGASMRGDEKQKIPLSFVIEGHAKE